MNTIKLSRAFCEEHLEQCFFEHNETTGQAAHVESFTARRIKLESSGYVYAGHSLGVFTFHQRNDRLGSMPMPLDWQIAMQERELIDINQDWSP